MIPGGSNWYVAGNGQLRQQVRYEQNDRYSSKNTSVRSAPTGIPAV